MNRYDVEAIANSPLPIGGTAKRLKLSLEAEEKQRHLGTMLQAPCASNSSSISFSAIQPGPTIPCGVPLDNSSTPYYHHNLFYNQYSGNQGISDASASSVSSMGAPMTSAGEYFVWPHQSY